ncbi:tetratricopeptide repeat protein [Alcanivorax sp.]|uniref:tetratricopeptide repeat protein n=1 Tax=Alcanivorax sp. TaxID=1872427 RepID=UPI0024376A16|nr:tetratricopeptide repeat protein [Alcanivorax sp.]
MSAVTSFRWLSMARAGVVLALLLGGCATTPGPQGTEGNIILNQDENALFNAAMQDLQQEKYQDGIRQLEKLVSQNGDSAVPYINMAIAYKKLEDTEQAETALQQAMKIEPDNPVANNEYALLLRKQGRFIEAREVYENILRKYPKFALANKNLGVLCDIYMKDYQCALDAYQAYSAVTPDDEEVGIWISDLEMRTQ